MLLLANIVVLDSLKNQGVGLMKKWALFIVLFAFLGIFAGCASNNTKKEYHDENCTKIIGPYGGTHWKCANGVNYYQPPKHWDCWVNWKGKQVCRWVN